MGLEPTCLALLALPPANPAGADTLLNNAQRPDGGWGSFAGDDQSSGQTGLALLTLNALRTFDCARERALRWLLRSRGREANWPWRWKFRTTDTRVRFDPGKFGWPWQPGACSWVVPTAFALLALKQTFPCHRPRSIAIRIRRGVEMLFDRACSAGGWNTGNGVVYGSPMAAHVDTTAIALLALQSESSNAVIPRSFAWLEREAPACQAPWSLAWAVLALHAWAKPVECLQRRLARLAESDRFDDTATLAAVVLALDCDNPANPFKALP